MHLVATFKYVCGGKVIIVDWFLFQSLLPTMQSFLARGKFINPDADSNPFFITLNIMRAATKLYESLITSEKHLWIRKQNPYPQDIIESLMKDGSQECIQVMALRIPSSVEQSIEAVTFHISFEEYYLDIIANELGFEDAAKVMISRNLGKASSETRLFFAAPKSYVLDPSSKLSNGKESPYLEGSPNVRDASREDPR